MDEFIKSTQQNLPINSDVKVDQKTITSQSGEIPVMVYDYLNIPVHASDPAMIDKVGIIYKMLKSNLSTESTGTILNEVKSINRRLGIPQIGENQVNRIYNWVKLHYQMQELKKQQSSLERK